jgi:hypothetical protein
MSKESSKMMKLISAKNKELFPLRAKRTQLKKNQKDNVAGFLEIEPREIIGDFAHTGQVSMVLPESALVDPQQARKEFRLDEEEKEHKEEESIALSTEKDVAIQFFVVMEDDAGALEATFSLDNILDGTTFLSCIPLGEEEDGKELKIKASFTSVADMLASVEREIEQIEQEVQAMKVEYQQIKQKEDEEQKQQEEEKKQQQRSSSFSSSSSPKKGSIHLSALDEDDDDDLELSKPRRPVMREVNQTSKTSHTTKGSEEKEEELANSSLSSKLVRWSTKGLQLAMIGGQLCLQFRFVWVFAFGFAFFHWKGDILRF